MKKVDGPEAKELSISGATICKSCLDTEEKVVRMTEKLKRSWDGKINRLVTQAQQDVIKGLSKIQGE